MPGLYQLPGFIRDFADHAGRNINSVKLFQHLLDISCGRTFSVHGDNFLFNLIDVFLQQFELKFAVPVPRNTDFAIKGFLLSGRKSKQYSLEVATLCHALRKAVPSLYPLGHLAILSIDYLREKLQKLRLMICFSYRSKPIFSL